MNTQTAPHYVRYMTVKNDRGNRPIIKLDLFKMALSFKGDSGGNFMYAWISYKLPNKNWIQFPGTDILIYY